MKERLYIQQLNLETEKLRNKTKIYDTQTYLYLVCLISYGLVQDSAMVTCIWPIQHVYLISMHFPYSVGSCVSSLCKTFE